MTITGNSFKYLICAKHWARFLTALWHEILTTWRTVLTDTNILIRSQEQPTSVHSFVLPYILVLGPQTNYRISLGLFPDLRNQKSDNGSTYFIELL